VDRWQRGADDSPFLFLALVGVCWFLFLARSEWEG
jgi:hypothetical protein